MLTTICYIKVYVTAAGVLELDRIIGYPGGAHRSTLAQMTYVEVLAIDAEEVAVR